MVAPNKSAATPLVTEMMGIQVPKNTVSSNKVAVRAYIRFLKSDTQFKYDFDDGDEMSLIVYFFGHGPQNGNEEKCLTLLRNALREFTVRYRSQRGSTEVTPSTMLGYILRLQRVLSNHGHDLNLLSGPIFNDKEHGLRAVLDNWFAKQKSRGMISKYHNVLP